MTPAKKKTAAKATAKKTKVAKKPAAAKKKVSRKTAAAKPPASKKTAKTASKKRTAIKVASKKAAQKKAAPKKATAKKAGPKKVTAVLLLTDDARGAAAETASPFGLKHTCFACGAKFYDLNKPEPVCPKCQVNQNEAPKTSSVAGKKKKKKKGRRTRAMAPLLDDDDEVVVVEPVAENHLGLDSVEEVAAEDDLDDDPDEAVESHSEPEDREA